MAIGGHPRPVVAITPCAIATHSPRILKPFDLLKEIGKSKSQGSGYSVVERLQQQSMLHIAGQ